MNYKKGCIFLVVFIFSMEVYGQYTGFKDSVEVVTNPFGGIKYYQHDRRLSMAQITVAMRPNAEAFRYLNRSKTNNTVAFITGFIGGALIGYEIGNAIGGQSVNWAVISAGAGIIGLSIPFDIGARKNAKKAVHLYNAIYRGKPPIQ
ncbi:MAG: hypothetical protein JNK14_17895 [Chitinophagaceae bacterium]|nr:hypothetical protein [Chitinophagaceae bacterium]